MHSRKLTLFVLISWLTIIFLAVTPLVTDADSQASELKPLVLNKPILPGRVAIIDLCPHFTTSIRVPAVIRSIVVGDPMLFKIEHSEREPEMVFIKPITVQPAESNLLITTTNGQTIGLLLRSRGEKHGTDSGLDAELAQGVHFLLNYRRDNSFLIGEDSAPSELIPQTLSLGSNPETPKETADINSIGQSASLIETLLGQQRHSGLPVLKGVTFSGGIGPIYEKERQIYVLFTVVNRSNEVMELLSPQVQLAGNSRRTGFSVRSEQLPVEDYRLSRRRLGPDERADGVVMFQKPAFKQSHETYLLQIAEAGAVDCPVLIPIPLGKRVSLDGGQTQ
jgi:hypothetical protein